MSENERNCSICGLPASQVGALDSNGSCAFCVRQELVRERTYRQQARKRENQPSRISDILSGPPTKDELAAAATVCERLAVHIESRGRDYTHRPKHLRDTIIILKGFLAVFLILLGCSHEVTEEPDAGTVEKPGSELVTEFARFEEREPIEQTEEPDAAIEQTEEPDAAIEQTEEPDAGIEQTEEPDAGIEQTEEPDAGIEETEEPDAGIEQTEEPDSGTVEEPDSGSACELLGSWSITILPSVFCFDPSNNTFDLEITDCDQTLVLPIETSDPSYGDFNGSITFHVTREGESLTGSADIEGTVHVYGQDMPCTSVATISGGKDGTREHS